MRSVFIDNGFPSRLVRKVMETAKQILRKLTVEGKPVYTHLSLKVDTLADIGERKLTSDINITLYTAKLPILFKSCPAVSLRLKYSVQNSAASFRATWLAVAKRIRLDL